MSVAVSGRISLQSSCIDVKIKFKKYFVQLESIRSIRERKQMYTAGYMESGLTMHDKRSLRLFYFIIFSTILLFSKIFLQQLQTYIKYKVHKQRVYIIYSCSFYRFRPANLQFTLAIYLFGFNFAG